MNKHKVQGKLPSFSMIVVKYSMASPMLKHGAKCGRTWISPYFHVFGNHIHFLHLLLISLSTTSHYYQAMVPILRHHIVITDFHPVLVAASSFTDFILLPEHNMYLNTPPSWSSLNYLSNEPSYAWNGFRTTELCLFYSGDAICPRLISDCAALNVSIISPCTGLQNWWFLMCWKEYLKDLLNINFSSIYISEHVLKSW
jgi:hypothetical protein